MFWACEEKPTQFWGDDKLVDCICELLIEMMNWVKAKFCVNYFIPDNNMMDHLIDIDLCYEMDALWRTSQSYQLILNVIDACFKYELTSANRTHHIESPAWIKRAYVIYQRVDNDYDNYTDLFCRDLTTYLKNAVYVELSDIYRGLCCQQRSVSCVSVSDKHSYFLKSESHLLLAVNLCESHERDVIDNCSTQFVQSMTNQFIQSDTGVSSEASNDNVELNTKCRSTADRHNSVNGRNEQKCLLYCRFVEKHENKLNYNLNEKIKKGRNVNIAIYFVTDMNTHIGTRAELCKEWPGWSPTVNISWFIAKAYLANLHYTTQRDASLTIQTCDDVIHVYRQSNMNLQFAERTFPVVLSTQWTSIYDKEIQELLGFYSLSSYVLDKGSSRSVYLGVCPVQFVIYVKLRTVMRAAHLFSVSTINKYIDDCNEHIHACQCDQKVNKGFNVLSQVLGFLFFRRPPIPFGFMRPFTIPPIIFLI